MMDAHIAEWRLSVAKQLAAVSKLFFVNPVTYFLLYKDAKEGKNFKKLPYPHGVGFEKLHSDPDFRIEKLVKPSIEIQLAKNADVVIAPSFFAEDENSAKFNLNLTMLAETIRYLRDQKIEKPLFALIYIGNTVFTRRVAINYIVDRYTDEGFDNAIRGYFVVIDKFDTRKTDAESLFGLAMLIYRLSFEGKLAFSMSIGAFGEILSAIGAAGFVGDKETASVDYLQKRPKAFGRPKNWLYIPEIFDYANDAEVRRIVYKCKCPACGGSVAMDTITKKRHLLYCRMQSMDDLSKQNPEKRIDFMKNRVERAIDFVDFCVNKYNSPFKKTHLANWRKVLESAKLLKQTEKDAELEKALLADLETKIL
jgi:hypothetical protein